ncbi:AbrB/MazE/SpoVT family DNA-binding domain-containing protein [uncultured Thiodictyon sp.]|jgi:antitoxin MazE|uniref:AbrB/MazE/SpoVT family DNA-binding domain-containing protein n=1 Tax=uncultured Thiodictyon sp. TaxID=1846217 RepID=UPI0025F2488E|nr:AbrB/MazE/SpoVT family DNA-binding domain-containing protein [uncultured Thiodictyon sp.]
MKSTLHRIGHNRAIIIPAPLLAECEIKDQIELSVEDGRIIISPVKPARVGWFENYPDHGAAGIDAWRTSLVR